MKIIYKADELELVKKIMIALGRDFEFVEEKAKALGVEIKSEAQLKAEVKAQADKPAREVPEIRGKK
jgi:hypothetical protein